MTCDCASGAIARGVGGQGSPCGVVVVVFFILIWREIALYMKI